MQDPEEYIKDIEQRIQELQEEEILQPRIYRQLDENEENIFNKSKVIIDKRASARAELIQAYIINCIRKGEPKEYIKDIAIAYHQNLEYLTKITDQKYLNAKSTQ